ncbi:hypothetical protein [Brachybacterium aquaticum]|uniref:Uncharacterized protein n=1 Tax=Brachybacterium aquaticum TaxID=1432564 RepID=A0A841AA79_9MICO|nr:hypothetical protein [Brachybacterium aquaticum]MBB5832099.1 hypothetical protein [Brachybacterium aquaticum]
MQSSFVVVLFLVLAVLLAIGILVVVALPHLRPPHDPDDEHADPRHSSRTGRN